MTISIVLLINRVRPVIPTLALVAGTIPHLSAALLYRIVTRAVGMEEHRVHIVQEVMYSFYQRYVLFIFENISGVRVRLYGDFFKCPADENVLYMSNHQCTVDWVVGDMIAQRICGNMGVLRYLMKDTLQYVPLYGWYFYMHGCVYVRRGRAKFREEKTRKELRFLANGLRRPFWLAIFPEGTRIQPSSAAKLAVSQEFSRKLGRPPMTHVLAPRVTGVHLAMEEQRGALAAVYDVTIAYSQSRDPVDGHHVDAPGMFDFVCGKEGEVVHLHISRIPIEEVPEGKEQLHSWLHGRFELKDDLLSQYYTRHFDDATDDAFPDPVDRHSVTPLHATITAAVVYGVVISPMLISATARKIYAAVWLGVSAVTIIHLKLIDAA